MLPINYGVPERPILQPILFVIFIDDLPSCITTVSTTFYADDIMFVVRGRSRLELDVKKISLE